MFSRHMSGILGIIPTEAFMDCKKLQRVIIGNGVTEIKNKAFMNCMSIESVFSVCSTNRCQNFCAE